MCMNKHTSAINLFATQIPNASLQFCWQVFTSHMCCQVLAIKRCALSGFRKRCVLSGFRKRCVLSGFQLWCNRWRFRSLHQPERSVSTDAISQVSSHKNRWIVARSSIRSHRKAARYHKFDYIRQPHYTCYLT